MGLNKRNWAINREAIKALVAVYGPRETHRQTGIPLGTVLSWCRRYKWRKADGLIHTSGINGAPGNKQKSPADAISEAMAKHKVSATVDLAKFTANAAKKAAQSEDPLSDARAVRDVAQVYRVIYPPEREEGLIEEAILIGTAKVLDDTEEIEASVEAIDVPAEPGN